MEQESNSVSEGNEIKPPQPKKIPDKIKRSQKIQKLEISKTSKPNTILSQIPRYVYLVAFFVLLSGVFFPLITTGADEAYSFVIGGAAILFLGLAGGILIFKATTSNKRQGILLAVGFALIAISLTLIFLIQYWWKLEFIRS
jgi:VIT1/CCC1 family predicted Fe2+/Mn2+ transporter